MKSHFPYRRIELRQSFVYLLHHLLPEGILRKLIVKKKDSLSSIIENLAESYTRFELIIEVYKEIYRAFVVKYWICLRGK